MILSDVLTCCCCGSICGDRYPAAYIDEVTGEDVHIVDDYGVPEYLCCECAG